MSPAATGGERLIPSTTRIALARQRRGLSVTGLAKKLDVNPKTVSRWELGETKPDSAAIELLSTVLDVSPRFFALDDIDELNEAAVSFRALSKRTARELAMSLACGRIATDIAAWMRANYRIPELNLPTLEGYEPERAAAVVRERWGLGTAPINNMLDVLEAHGIHVFSLANDCQSVDAFSFTREGRGYVLLNIAKTGERRRFDAAHELGHLVLHCGDEVPHGKEAEADAQRFAAAFLMPAPSVQAASLRNATVPTILKAKRHWKVAATALTHRLHELGLLTDWGYRDAFVRLSQMGYRSGEPAGAITPEVSQIATKVVKSLRTQKRRDADMAEALGLTIQELGAHLFKLLPFVIEGDADGSSPGNAPQLTVVKGGLS